MSSPWGRVTQRNRPPLDGPGYFGREELFERLEHYVAALAIDLADELYVLVEKAIAGYFIGDELVKVEVCRSVPASVGSACR